MHPHDQHFLIIRAIEDADLTALGHHVVATPQKIMIQFFAGRRFERMNIATLRIHSGHDVLDGAVFAGRVHALKNQQQRPAILGVEFFLHLAGKTPLCSSNFPACFLDFTPLVSAGSKSLRRNLLPFVTQNGSASRVASAMSFRSFMAWQCSTAAWVRTGSRVPSQRRRTGPERETRIHLALAAIGPAAVR